MLGNPHHLSTAKTLSESRTRMSQIHDCLSHLEIIPCDPDATRSLIGHIRWLALSADTALLASTSSFCLEVHTLISTPAIDKKLNGATLHVLKKCCDLLAWQLELTNPRTGVLHMDKLEEQHLLQSLGLALNNPRDTLPESTKQDFF